MIFTVLFCHVFIVNSLDDEAGMKANADDVSEDAEVMRRALAASTALNIAIRKQLLRKCGDGSEFSVFSLRSFVLTTSHVTRGAAEATYKYTMAELVAELKGRISNAVETKAFSTDILAAVVSSRDSLPSLLFLMQYS